MIPVSKIPIWQIIIYFLVYLILHIFLGIEKKLIEKQIKKEPNNLEIKNTYKITCFAFKWFPFIYTIFIILMMIL